MQKRLDRLRKMIETGSFADALGLLDRDLTLSAADKDVIRREIEHASRPGRKKSAEQEGSRPTEHDAVIAPAQSPTSATLPQLGQAVVEEALLQIGQTVFEEAKIAATKTAARARGWGRDKLAASLRARSVPASSAWETMPREALSQLPSSVGARILGYIRHSPHSRLELVSALRVPIDHLSAVLGELVAQGGIECVGSDGREAYQAAGYAGRSAPDAESACRSSDLNAPSEPHPVVGTGKELELLLTASEIAPLSLARAVRLTRLAERDVRIIIAQLEASGRLLPMDDECGQNWVRAR